MKNEFLSKVLIDDGDLIMLFPEELLKLLNLQANEILKWTVNGDEIHIKRVKVIDNRKSDTQ